MRSCGVIFLFVQDLRREDPLVFVAVVPVGVHEEGVFIEEVPVQLQLMTLPGIGEVKAQAILEYRTQHGGFSSIEEIRQVNGIGESIFSQIKNKIKI